MILFGGSWPSPPMFHWLGGFEAWRDKIWHEEEKKYINQIENCSESQWAVEGISARRKRNQGRLRNLEKLRAEKQSYIPRSGLAKMKLESRTKSGQLVLKVDKVSKSFGDRYYKKFIYSNQKR